MIWDRGELLGLLKLVQPALGKPQAGAASIFENVWITDVGLLACNDAIGMLAMGRDDAPVGGVHGERLIRLLSNSNAKDVKLSDGDGRLHVEAGSFKAHLAIDTGDPPLVWPQVEDGMPQVEVDAAFVAACRMAKVIVDTHGNSVQARGLTLIIDDAGLALYATDRVGLMVADLGQPPDMGPERTEVALSMPFVEQMIKRAPGWLTLGNDFCLFDTDQVSVRGRYLALDREPPLRFEAKLRTVLPAIMAPLPDGFHAALVRAGALAEKEGRLVRLTVADNVLSFDSRSGVGSFNDTLLGRFEHPPIHVLFDQKRTERVTARFGLTHLGINKHALTFTNDDESLSYVTSVQGS